MAAGPGWYLHLLSGLYIRTYSRLVARESIDGPTNMTQNVLAQGKNGSVMKQPRSGYEARARVASWMKKKSANIFTQIAIILKMLWYNNNNNNRGKCDAFLLSLALDPRANSSRMWAIAFFSSTETRKNIKICEFSIKYLSLQMCLLPFPWRFESNGPTDIYASQRFNYRRLRSPNAS